MRYNLGNTVWAPAFDRSLTYVICPDCLGSGRLRVIMGDESIVSIDCRNCERGCEGPQGRVEIYDRNPRPKLITVNRIQVQRDGIEYLSTESYLYKEIDLFDTREGAEARAGELAEIASREERERIAKKEKDTHSWAWNANYHRQCIRRAQKDIEYHTSKLNVANLKAKEDKKAEVAA